MATGRSRPIERLAKALRPPAEELASALQDCLNEAARKGAEKAAQTVKDELVPRLDRMDARLDRQDAAIRQMREHMDARLDRQDDTLRMVWKQVKGNGKLPIDD